MINQNFFKLYNYSFDEKVVIFIFERHGDLKLEKLVEGKRWITYFPNEYFNQSHKVALQVALLRLKYTLAQWFDQ
jgi:hypothetical protein